jgi:hypothetical protein
VQYLYLDESGSHDLTRIDPQYPVFVLGGVIVPDEATLRQIEAALTDFKVRFFGASEIILHTADIVRNRAGFEPLADSRVRRRFLADLTGLVRRLDFKVVACAILKDRHIEAYGPLAVDPYLLSLGIVVERFCFEIGGGSGQGGIVVERRGGRLERELQIAWDAIATSGTRYVRASTIAGRISSLQVRGKRANDAGLQLADLVLSPLARWVIGKPDRPDTRVVRSKLRRGPNGEWRGAGLIVLPKETGRGPLRSTRPRPRR